jgi:hypothetical protein
VLLPTAASQGEKTAASCHQTRQTCAHDRTWHWSQSSINQSRVSGNGREDIREKESFIGAIAACLETSQ